MNNTVVPIRDSLAGDGDLIVAISTIRSAVRDVDPVAARFALGKAASIAGGGMDRIVSVTAVEHISLVRGAGDFKRTEVAADATIDGVVAVAAMDDVVAVGAFEPIGGRIVPISVERAPGSACNPRLFTESTACRCAALI